MAKKYKRPTHESDALAIMMSEDVAPELLPLIQQLGDPVAAAIALSVRRFPDAWKALAIDVVYHRAMLSFLKKLHSEGKPVKREWLRRIKNFVSKYSEDVAAKPSLYLRNMIVGVEVWSVLTIDYATELIVDVYDTYGRHIERFKLMIEG
jgi:hypothetical protein